MHYRLRPITSKWLHLRGHRAPHNDHAAKIAALFLAYLAEYARIATSHARIPFAHRAHEPLWKLTILPPMQPAHGESTKSPLQSANAADAGALRHRMEYGSDVHHASTLTPQPQAAIHLQPPFARKPAECWFEWVSASAAVTRWVLG